MCVYTPWEDGERASYLGALKSVGVFQMSDS